MMCAYLTILLFNFHNTAGGQGGRPPPQPEHWGGIAPPPTLGYNTEVPKSPLLSLFCNSVYWLKPHNNVNSRPPNLEVLPPPLYRVESVQHIHTLRPQLANINMLVSSIQYVEIIKSFVIERNMFRSFISCVYILHELFGVMVNVEPVTMSTGCSSLNTSQ